MILNPEVRQTLTKDRTDTHPISCHQQWVPYGFSEVWGWRKQTTLQVYHCTVTVSRSVMSDSFAIPRTAAHQASLSISNSQSLLKLSPLSQWCHPTIPSSVIPSSSHLQSCPASGSFQMSQFFTSSGQRIGVSASASVVPMNIQDWSPLGWTGWISLQSKGLSRVFSNTTVQKHQFFKTQLSL